jgi:aryl-alcohol dehydrogenase-like predicted oxidoreductase
LPFLPEHSPRMETRRIGSLEVSLVGLGCNNFGMRLDEAASARVIHAALDAGITFFDTADIYGSTQSEVFLGRALAGRRDSVVIATKFGMAVDDTRQGARPDYIRRAAEDSLRRLGTNRIDLYQLHQPDPSVPIADTLGALDELVRAGKVREIGCSNFSAEQLREARAATNDKWAHFVSVQNEFSVLHREPEREVLPECQRLGVKFLPYFPLASGLLTGKYKRGQPPPPETRLSLSWAATRFLSDEKLATVDALTAFAHSRDHSVLDLAISWLASRPAVASVIAGATSSEQILRNVEAARWRLTDSDRAEIDTIAPLSDT